MSLLQSLFRKKTIENVLKQSAENEHGTGLTKSLGVRDLTAFGIAAIIGAGIFSTIGKASADGGPGVVLLFLFTAIACSFAAFAYAEFASMVPVSGSAYTYSYVAFGEIIAWIIGWALIMEYGIGNITVAISWSDYFTGLLNNMGLHVPEWCTMDYLTAEKGYKSAMALMESGKPFAKLDAAIQSSHTAWTSAPKLFGMHIVADIPALMIVIFITWLIYRGIEESRKAGNIMVLIKLSIVVLVIIVGAFYVNTDNWNPFLPNGLGGVLKGVSAVFFAYIGFDAISTTAEECKNPQRDLPRGMMWAIIICTILYVIIALVLTGMVNYKELSVGDPLAFVFEKLHLKWLSGIIAVSAVVAMASVLLVFQLGQPRIWMSMSRDGLMPKAFSRIHPRFHTPSFATIVTGFLVAIPALFMNLTMVTDLCSIGTLFAFVLVCAGVLRLQNDPNVQRGKFRTPYMNAQYILPVLLIITAILCWTYNKQGVTDFMTNAPKNSTANEFVTSLDKEEINTVKSHIISSDSIGLVAKDNDIEAYLASLDESQYSQTLQAVNVVQDKKIQQGWSLFKHKIPMWIFIIACILMIWLTFKHKYSLIPLLGLISCLYMMSEMGVSNWMGFSIWLLVGLIIYFSYGRKNSKLAN